MKLLFLVNAFPSPDLPDKGAFNFRAVNQLTRHVDVSVVHLRAWRPKRPVVDRYELEGLQVTAFSSPYTDKISHRITAWMTGLYSQVFWRILRKEIQQATVIHSAGASLAGVVGAYAAKRSGKRHIAQFIGSDINFVLPRLDGYWPVKGWHKSVDVCCCNSRELQRVVSARYPCRRVKAIYRGVDLKEFPFVSRQQTASEQPGFLYLGGLSQRKGNPHGRNLKGGVTVLRSWKAAVDGRPKNQNSPRLLFGGPDVHEEEVRSILGADPSTYNIELIGYVNKHRVKDFMSRVHVVLVASMAEGLPNVAMEAAAMGCVVIGTRVGGIPEVIDDEKTGFLVNAADEVGLRERIERIFTNPEQLLAMGRAARERMEQTFDASSFVSELLKIYLLDNPE